MFDVTPDFAERWSYPRIYRENSSLYTNSVDGASILGFIWNSRNHPDFTMVQSVVKAWSSPSRSICGLIMSITAMIGSRGNVPNVLQAVRRCRQSTAESDETPEKAISRTDCWVWGSADASFFRIRQLE